MYEEVVFPRMMVGVLCRLILDAVAGDAGHSQHGERDKCYATPLSNRACGGKRL